MYVLNYLLRSASSVLCWCFSANMFHIHIYVCGGSSVDLEKVNVYWDMNCSLIIHNMLIIVGTCPLHF